MKKFLSIILCLAMIFSLSVTAFAAENSNVTEGETRNGIIGTIVHEEACEISSAYQTRSSNSETGTATMSYVKNSNGSYTMYQYINDTLTDEHTTIPGSGIVNHVFYNKDGSVTQTTENVTAKQGISTAQLTRGVPTQVSIRDMGYMHYYHSFTNTTYSIFVKIYDRYYEDSEYTFRAGTAKTLADWTSTLLSVWSFTTNPATMLTVAIDFLSLTGILNAGLNAVYTAAITKTIPCSYNNQEFYGNATAPSTNYPEGTLVGTYAVIRNGTQTKVITEGYTVRNWGQSTFGRMMMYQVFGIDEVPTSWSNLD